MTQWRDARLQRALDRAPDAQLQPLARTREAIRDAARQAVAPAAPQPWWRRAWEASGRRSTWTPALATVLLATLVTVLWRGEPVPDAQPDAVAAKHSAPAAAPAPAPAEAPAPAVQSAPAPRAADPVAAPKPDAPAPTSPAKDRAARPKAEAPVVTAAPGQQPGPAPSPAAAPAAAAMSPPAPAPARAETAPATAAPGGTALGRADSAQPRLRQAAEASAPSAAAPPAPAAVPPAPEALAKSAVREERSLADSAAAPAAAAAPAPAAPPAAVAPPASNRAAATAPAAPAPAARAQAAPPPAAPSQAEGARGLQAEYVPWEAWTELRIAAAGREVVLARRRAPQLADLVNRLARMAQSTEAMSQPVRQSFELSSRGALLGVLELGDDQVRWVPIGERGPSRTARPDAATLQALREQVEAVLPR